MKVPVMTGVIERRLLVNYRVDPEVAARLVPARFRPQVVDGWAVAGICLIRLGGLRPRGLPRALGLRSEGAAHRVAVEWDTPDGVATGVWIPRRDSGSLANAVAGGRLFPGEHHRARFRVRESGERVRVAFDSADGAVSADVAAEIGGDLGSGVFGDIDAASRFFAEGAVGWSPARGCDGYDGVRLHTRAWRVEPARVTAVRSSFFEDPERFPPGSATLDCALLMRGVPVSWHPAG